ncbi:sulfotransferase domain-containing protein [Robertkochia aurantiaca]|uniref:sulfotransferase domain-containing protein n=1 Tax=Robertkochia aurantiaca TaxID=2873700 RepID=UPI001CCE334C|nr:sulfotransferase domain-containing protein [Robertkochia sp. 3YJGBD-33]
MLVIANGAFKSGSTWQRNIIRHFMDFSPLPEAFRSPHHDSFIHTDKLQEIVDSDIIREKNFLAKAHIFKKEHIEILTRNTSDVYVFMIQRDIRDAIVSHYNHFINVRRIKPSFNQYYWTVGRFKAMQILKYNQNWATYTDNVLHSSFEQLKTHTRDEVLKFAEFLGVNPDTLDLESIIENTSLNKVREKSDRKWFFRKGKIGDHKNYLTGKMEADLKKLESGFNLFEKAGYYLMFELR